MIFLKAGSEGQKFWSWLMCILSMHTSSTFMEQKVKFNCDSWGLKYKITVDPENEKSGKVSLPGELLLMAHDCHGLGNH